MDSILVNGTLFWVTTTAHIFLNLNKVGRHSIIMDVGGELVHTHIDNIIKLE